MSSNLIPKETLCLTLNHMHAQTLMFGMDHCMSCSCIIWPTALDTLIGQHSLLLDWGWGCWSRLHPLVRTVSTHTSSRLHRVRLSPACLSTSDLDRESEGLLWLGTRSNHTWVCSSSSSWRAVETCGCKIRSPTNFSRRLPSRLHCQWTAPACYWINVAETVWSPLEGSTSQALGWQFVVPVSGWGQSSLFLQLRWRMPDTHPKDGLHHPRLPGQLDGHDWWDTKAMIFYDSGKPSSLFGRLRFF